MSNSFKTKLIIYTIIFSLFSALIFGYLWSINRCLIYPTDGLDSSIPVFEFIRTWIPGLFSADTRVWYDFSIGFGENILETMNWIGLGDPAYLLLCLGTRDSIPYISSFIVFMKIFLSGIAMLYVTEDKNCSTVFSVFIALAYAFSGYFYISLLNFAFISATITFPLIILGIERVMRTMRISKCLVLSISYQALCTYYFLFIELFFAGFFALFLLINEFTKKRKAIVKRGLYLLGQVLLGISISAVILVPAVLGLFNSVRAVENVTLPITKIFPNFFEAIGGVLVSGKIYLQLCLPILTTALFFRALFSKEIPWVYKLFGAGIVILLYNEPFGRLLNGLTYAHNDRWKFIAYFFIYYLIIQLPHKEFNKFGKAETLLTGLLLLVGVIYTAVIREYYVSIIFATLGILLITYLSSMNGNKAWVLSYVNVLVLCLLPLLRIGYNFAAWLPSYASIQSQYEDTSAYERYTNSGEDSERYRVDLFHNFNNIENAGMYWDVYTCSEFLSTLNKSNFEFFKSYGLFGSESSGIRCTGLGSMSLLEDLFAVKYYWDSETETISRNYDYLNWSIVYDSVIDGDTFDKMNMIERYDALSKYGVVSDDNIQMKKAMVRDCNYEICDFTINGSYMNEYTGYFEETAIVTIKDRTDDADEIYFCVDSLTWDRERFYGGIIVDGTEIALSTQKSLFMKVYPDEFGQFDLACYYGKNIELKGITIFKYSPKDAVEEMQTRNICTDIHVEDDGIRGRVSGKTRLVCFPAFYDDNWKATINGQEVPVLKVNNGLIGIITTEDGDNAFEVQYKYGGTLILCLIISLTSIIIFGALLYIDKRKMNAECRDDVSV